MHSSGIGPRMHSLVSSIGCLLRHILVNAGDVTGLMLLDMVRTCARKDFKRDRCHTRTNIVIG